MPRCIFFLRTEPLCDTSLLKQSFVCSRLPTQRLSLWMQFGVQWEKLWKWQVISSFYMPFLVKRNSASFSLIVNQLIFKSVGSTNPRGEILWRPSVKLKEVVLAIELNWLLENSSTTRSGKLSVTENVPSYNAESSFRPMQFKCEKISGKASLGIH